MKPRILIPDSGYVRGLSTDAVCGPSYYVQVVYESGQGVITRTMYGWEEKLVDQGGINCRWWGLAFARAKSPIVVRVVVLLNGLTLDTPPAIRSPRVRPSGSGVPESSR